MHGTLKECGFVKKPDFLLKRGPDNKVFDPKEKLPIKSALKDDLQTSLEDGDDRVLNFGGNLLSSLSAVKPKEDKKSLVCDAVEIQPVRGFVMLQTLLEFLFFADSQRENISKLGSARVFVDVEVNAHLPDSIALVVALHPAFEIEISLDIAVKYLWKSTFYKGCNSQPL
ncbi:hypothetical protein Nepgr_016377 [Nepenthes gracilis]|uniref:Uncharacterized protein n=1 Tax=Nepenthes gracilis TaxID=150966 RepID=A0AAD3XS85_NEPGR|nr:hypothetical protein Nepgr_016377 [Nepenthes gracilis]